MKHVIGTICALGIVAGCAPTVPDSASGVGFDSYSTYQNDRASRDEALTTGGRLPPPAEVRATPLPSTPDNTAREQQAAMDAAAANSGVLPLEASPANPAPEAVTATGISAENDFSAVSEQRTIESDAARIARNRQQYKVIEPGALPTRSGSSEPNIVAYALQTRHPRGTALYNRSRLNAEARFRRNCAAYASPDQAQTDFLSRGGPERDRLGLDPDGDGYACAWDPAPFRLVER